ncbi:DUF2599 domain-containing protein [Enterococcus sp. LJL98]
MKKIFVSLLLGVTIVVAGVKGTIINAEENKEISINLEQIHSTRIFNEQPQTYKIDNGLQKYEFNANVSDKNTYTFEIKSHLSAEKEILELNLVNDVTEIRDENKEYIGSISFLDITDTKGNDLSHLIIEKKVEDNKIIQTIDTSNIEGEIHATAYTSIRSMTYSSYFNSSSWITRDGKKSLSISPKTILTTTNGSPNAESAKRNDSWNKLLDKHSKDSNWKNTSSMKSQYICHIDFAGWWKTPWNIEPWRTGTANFNNKCNP